MSERQDPTPAALYARVSSDRQDVDLSVASQLRALRDYADKNGYLIAREYVDEAQSGRVADRPEFRKMIDEASRPESPFHEILVWKFSRFTRKREHAVAFKSMLRRKGIRVVSITEQAEDTSTGRLLEGIIESVDEFYSENLAQEVLRGMREAASRGFWVASRTPYGYNRVMVQDGPKKRPTLEPDPTTTPILKRIFDMAEAGRGMTDITRTLNDEGIASPAGKLWGKTSVHAVLKNEVYTGALVWGAKAKDNAEPVRVDKAFPGIISKAQFRRVNKLMRSRAPKVSHPRRVGSSYLLSGLVKCKTCNRALSGQDSKSGQFSYYVCQSIMKRGSGACDSPRLNARNFEELVVGKIRSNILTESSIRALVKVVDEEMDGVASEQRKRLETIDSELADVRRRLDRLYNLVETTELDMADVTPRIRDHRERQGRLESSAQEARAILSQRREVLDDVQTITAYAQDMSEFLNESELTERRAFIESFVKEIVVMPGNALMRYTVPMPDDSSIPGGVAEKVALNGSVLSTVQNGGADLTGTTLRHVNLRGTNLRRANLGVADLWWADLTGADLKGADLQGAVLHYTNLNQAQFAQARFSFTVIADCDLSEAQGLESAALSLDRVRLLGPCRIGVDTLVNSYHGSGNRLTPELETFFLDAGVLRELLAALPQILAEVQYHTAFVGYGEPDRSFAEQLVGDLRTRGVSCWIYSLDGTPGERTWEEISRKRREAEKMIVLCSSQALVREGVVKEIEEQIDEERDKMIPVSLDNLWKEAGFRVIRGSRDLKPFLLERKYADFSNTSSYEQSLERLLKGLERGDRPAVE